MRGIGRTFLLQAAVASAAFAVASCASIGQEARVTTRELVGYPEDVPVFGMVYDGRNQPIDGVTVLAAGRAVAESDISGRFVMRLTLGTHALTFRKDGFEVFQTEVNLTTSTQALHVRMTSFSELTDRARSAIAAHRWQEARDAIARARDVDEDSLIPRYLDAVLAARMDQPEEALRHLEGIVNTGIRDQYVHLFMADLYQYAVDMPERALEQLLIVHRLVGSDEVTARIRELEEVLGSEQ